MTPDEYKRIATRARRRVLDMVFKAQTSHIGSNFSSIDLLAVLYMGVVKNLDESFRHDRDRVIASKGWIAASMYHFLAEKGVVPEKDLETYCMPDSPYIGLAEPTVRGIEAAGGAMGHGLPMGTGMALGAKRANESWHTYVLMSDGEMDCGTTWESAMIASHHKLDNLTVIIDYNKWQALGRTNDVLQIEPLKDKWVSFGWEVLEIDGHDYTAIEKALRHKREGSPLAIIAHTVKGKGVKEFEDKLVWHYKNIPEDVYKKALKELEI